MAIIESMEAFAVKKALGYLDKDPETNLPKLADWFDRFDVKNTLAVERAAVRKVIEDKDNNWYQLIMSLWKDIDKEVRNRLFENLIINGCLLGYQRQVENQKKYNCNIPWAILMDPTSACNLHCTGCWAAEYGKYGISRLVYVSSVHAIPEKEKGQVIRETNRFSASLVKGIYGKTKAEATAYVKRAAQKGLDAVIVHPSGIIGPGDDAKGYMTETIRLYLRGYFPTAIEGGYDFVDVRDVAEGIINCAELGK